MIIPITSQGQWTQNVYKSCNTAKVDQLRFFLSHPQCGRKASHLTKTLLKRRDPFNRIMNAKWILVLFVGLHMALHISNAEVYDELLRQDAEFENRQPQKRSESSDFFKCFIYFVMLSHHSL